MTLIITNAGLLHSTPKFPATDSGPFTWQSGENIYGQTFVRCAHWASEGGAKGGQMGGGDLCWLGSVIVVVVVQVWLVGG